MKGKDKKGLIYLGTASVFALLGIVIEPMRIIFILAAGILATVSYLQGISEIVSILKNVLKRL